MLARATGSGGMGERGARGNLVVAPILLRTLSAGGPVQTRPSSFAAAAGCWDRETDRCCSAFIATSLTSSGQVEGEPRGWDYSWALQGSMAREGFATGCRLGIKLDLDAVNGRLKNAVDRWYNHLLIFILMFLALLQPPSLAIFPLARSSALARLSRA